jgi:predicted short-subunit dehydrogenase-like oxidoreductase (DUF2520 family)
MDMKVTIIGAGNLATRVAVELHRKGVEICQVYSRTEASASMLAAKIGCPFVTRTELISDEAGLFIVAVNDKVLAELLPKINFSNKLVAHTAGSIDMDVLACCSANYGVFYPLQTFSKTREVDFQNIPICIEANTPENLQVLSTLANTVSTDVRVIDSQQRKSLHVAAVFACNFVNHMYAIASELVQKYGVPFDILKPLISETAEKVNELLPRDAQTGPAVRNDQNVIGFHMNMIDDPKWRELYRLISESIYKYQSGNEN